MPGVDILICRVVSADWRPGRVYFLTLLEPLAGTTGLWPLPPGRPVSVTVGDPDQDTVDQLGFEVYQALERYGAIKPPGKQAARQ